MVSIFVTVDGRSDNGGGGGGSRGFHFISYDIEIFPDDYIRL